MKFLIFLIPLVISEADLEKENSELELANEELRNQLKELAANSNLKSQIEDDYAYNKSKLTVLLEEFEREGNSIIQLSLIEEMLTPLQSLYETSVLLGGSIEEVESKTLLETHRSLKSMYDTAKTSQSSQEFIQLYNDLSLTLRRKEMLVQSLQQENANLHGSFVSKKAQLDDLNKEISVNFYKLKLVQEEIESNAEDYKNRIDSLRFNVRTSQEQIASRQNTQFLDLQKNEDVLISALQQTVSLQSTTLDQVSLEKSALIAKTAMLNNKIEKLQVALQAKDRELQDVHNIFEQHRTEVEKQVIGDNGQHKQFNSELLSIGNKHEEQTHLLRNCQQQVQVLKTNIANKDFAIETIQNSIKDAANREELAFQAREKEVDIYVQSVKTYEDFLFDIQETTKEVKPPEEIKQEFKPLLKFSLQDNC